MPKMTMYLSDDAKKVLVGIGERLKMGRIARDLTIEIVAADLGTSSTRIRRAEAGEHTVSIGLYSMLLEHYGFLEELEALATWKNDPIIESKAQGAATARKRASRSTTAPGAGA